MPNFCGFSKSSSIFKTSSSFMYPILAFKSKPKVRPIVLDKDNPIPLISVKAYSKVLLPS